jgi:hypothetical protein
MKFSKISKFTKKISFKWYKLIIFFEKFPYNFIKKGLDKAKRFFNKVVCFIVKSEKKNKKRLK